ncbi:PREDICTED: uncharacterized protein LOC105976337 [Erythranthe guttata]|uniref:uncharacterized protein LOC105976337 n=1 Tax=Erythranthe guttata TaxID=4155 RepID=UPI00064D9D8A|nr:PREDICTED: uncharacterized protein LOC105976337 [Erythranthe guttata]|eukprot:XP_012857061.1 PREDICTED: uncharacterized protein LOC105976337 [Erythranthe guttata]
MTEFVHDYYCRRLGFVAVYARCSRSERRVLWNSFRDIFETIGDTPWISGGDFNSILLESERNRSVSDRRLDMADIRLLERLDRILYNSAWLDLLPITQVTHLSRTWSDHAPLLVSSAASSSRPPASFRFQHMWIRHATFRQIVEQVWDFPCAQTGMHRLHTKLRRLKQKLQWWNWNVFGDVFKNKERAEAAVLEAEHIYDLDRSPENRANLKKATAELTLMLNIEEDFWKQKAACRWATDGERNSKFFHSLVKKKRCVNRIHSISHGDSVLTSAQEIKDSGVDFFSKLLTDDMPSLLPVDESLFSAPQRDFSSVSTRPSVEEIKDAVFGICQDSASGPDGYSSLFYQHCWDLIQCDVCEAVWDFFEGGSMPASFTATTLVLIPKVDFPTAWTDFRPISLCNVTNKIITKVLTNRLAPHLPHIISPSQSGFVQGRLISDNILLAQEMVHSISVRCRNPNLILKLDMAKAYDRVQWRFLFRVLELMGFSANLVDIIRRCVSSCQFSLLINGELTGYFTSSRGLRQGDPLSPTLFVLAAEYFSRGLDALYSRCPSMFYSTREGIPISHLAYADDVMIFTSCHNFGLKKLRDFLDHYCRTSGQLISVHKSTFTVDRACSDGHLRTISRILSYPRKDLPIIYLGAPLYKGRDRGSLFHTLIDRMQARISGWARTALAFGGRLALIRSTLSTMALHLVQVIQPPQYIIQQIEQCMARFLWGSYGNQRRPHWVAWETICRPISEGGLGLRRLTDVIDAFTYKLWFRFRAQDSLWARFLRNKYCRNRFPGSSVVSSLYSTVWKRMCRVRERVQAQIFWRIGPGHVYFWHDHWFGDGPLSGIIDGGRLTSVRVEYYLVNGQWDRNKLAEDIPFEWIDRICSVPISGASGDLPIWRASSDVQLSIGFEVFVLFAYNFLKIWAAFIPCDLSLVFCIHSWAFFARCASLISVLVEVCFVLILFRVLSSVFRVSVVSPPSLGGDLRVGSCCLCPRMNLDSHLVLVPPLMSVANQDHSKSGPSFSDVVIMEDFTNQSSLIVEAESSTQGKVSTIQISPTTFPAHSTSPLDLARTPHLSQPQFAKFTPLAKSPSYVDFSSLKLPVPKPISAPNSPKKGLSSTLKPAHDNITQIRAQNPKTDHLNPNLMAQAGFKSNSNTENDIYTPISKLDNHNPNSQFQTQNG